MVELLPTSNKNVASAYDPMRSDRSKWTVAVVVTLIFGALLLMSQERNVLGDAHLHTISNIGLNSELAAARQEIVELRDRAMRAEAKNQNSWTIGMITDLDKDSKDKKSKKPKFHAFFKRAVLRHQGSATSGPYSVQWKDEPDVKLVSAHNEAGRGMELSELVTYKGRLYAPDDRTGILYEITDPLGKKPRAVPRFLLMEGSGNTDKGQKNEWATVKDGTLYVGSYGKEYTDTIEGKYVVTSRTNLWVATVDPNGKVTKTDWTHNYAQVRAAGDAAFPGYMVQEAVLWSDVYRQWFVLPRRASAAKYDEEKDENMGTNMLLVADEDFGKVTKYNIGEVTDNGRRGFSSAKFVPGTNDEVIVALKSMEHEEKDPSKKYFSEQESYITVFNWKTQQVLMPETRVGGTDSSKSAYKFEGIDFLF